MNRQIPAETAKTAPGNWTSCWMRDDFLLKTNKSHQLFDLFAFFQVLVLVIRSCVLNESLVLENCVRSEAGLLKRIQIFHLIPVSIQEAWPQSPPQLWTTNAKPQSEPSEINPDTDLRDISPPLFSFSKVLPTTHLQLFYLLMAVIVC